MRKESFLNLADKYMYYLQLEDCESHDIFIGEQFINEHLDYLSDGLIRRRVLFSEKNIFSIYKRDNEKYSKIEILFFTEPLSDIDRENIISSFRQKHYGGIPTKIFDGEIVLERNKKTTFGVTKFFVTKKLPSLQHFCDNVTNDTKKWVLKNIDFILEFDNLGIET